jgi:hypothetical protein
MGVLRVDEREPARDYLIEEDGSMLRITLSYRNNRHPRLEQLETLQVISLPVLIIMLLGFTFVYGGREFDRNNLWAMVPSGIFVIMMVALLTVVNAINVSFYVWNSVGREIIEITPEIVQLQARLAKDGKTRGAVGWLPVGLRRAMLKIGSLLYAEWSQGYAVREIRNLRVVTEAPALRPSLRRSRSVWAVPIPHAALAFNYRGHKIYFAGDSDEADLQTILAAIRQRFPTLGK